MPPLLFRCSFPSFFSAELVDLEVADVPLALRLVLVPDALRFETPPVDFLGHFLLP